MRKSWSGLNVFERFAPSDDPVDGSSGGDVLDRFGNTISNRPKTTFLVIMILTMFFFLASSGALPRQENSMSDNISTNVDQYIPEGTEEKRVLDIVRENWATKVVIIFIQTGNAFDPTCTVNVTNRDVLEEISSVEGDDFYSGSNFARGDSGRDDWVEYIFSLPTLIKEINSSSPRMVNVLEEEMAQEILEQTGLVIDVSDDDDVVNDQAKYAIPEDQDTVDQIIAQIPNDVLTSFCADTNGDDIWDSTYVMMGCLEETPDEYEKNFIDHVILNRRVAGDTDAEDPYFEDGNGPHHTKMAQTGLIAIMIDITDECNDQLMQTMPLAILFVVLVMLGAHRNVKVFLIAGIPLVCTIFWTFGIITLTNLELSPLVVAAMPMLIGLSVDYSLHISNRITEFEEEGFTIKEGIRKTFHTTGVAVLLSAVTTMIGFAALLVAPLSPIRMLGLLLIVGIASAFFLSLTIVPCIVLIFHYRKPELQIWERVANVPIRHRWSIIGAVAIVTLISLANLSTMTETPEEQQDFDSQGLESLEAIQQMSEIWSRGSTSLLVIEPKASVYPTGGALNDTAFLDQIEEMQNRITQIEKHVDIEDVSAMTIVDLFKSVALNVSWTSIDERVPDLIKDLIPIPYPDPGEIITYHYTITYWDFIHLSNDPDFQRRAIRIFYNSLTQEARDMLMTPDYSMTLCMIQYPYSGRAIQEQIIDSVNGIVDDINTAPGSTTAISQTTGGAAISITIHEAIMDTQMKTLLLSLLFVFIALTLVFTKGSKAESTGASFKEGLRYSIFTMIPVATVVAWQPLIMKSVSSFEGGASLNFMTAMISSVVIGAGIDFGVHITERIREEGETLAGIKRAVQHTGQSIMEANLTTVAGLTGGLFVVWFRGFFSVLLLLLIYSMFAGMILLPAVYAVFAARNGKIDDEPGREEDKPSDAVPMAESVEEPPRKDTMDLIGDFSDEGVEWEIGD
jgi:predicted RND superfamily exporter protein